MFQPSPQVIYPVECSLAATKGLVDAGAEGDTRRPAIAPTRRPAIAPTRRPAIAPTRRPAIAPARRPAIAPARPFLLLLTLIAAILTFSPTPVHASWSWGGCGDHCSGATLALGQQRINQGSYEQAITTFTCLIAADPLSVDAYRGRIEAELLLNRYSDAVRDYTRVTAVVLPAHPDAADTILASYHARLAANPWNVPALTGASFAHWWFSDYAAALPLLDRLIVLRPFRVYGHLFRGSSRLFVGENVAGGEADIAHALLLAPFSRDVRFIVADAYTYAQPDPDRAFAQAMLALQWGLDTPRVNAILASALLAAGDLSGAAVRLERHIDIVTTETVDTDPLAAGNVETLDLVPGRTYELPVAALAGQTIAIATGSPSEEIGDSILVLLAPDGTPVAGSDDYIDYFAGLDWVAPQTGTYTLRVTSFESVGTGQLVVTRD